MQINMDDFHRIAQAQGQRRFGRETFEEFEQRVTELHKKREKRLPPWRVENTAVADRS